MTFPKLAFDRLAVLGLHGASGFWVDEACPCAVEGGTLAASGSLLLLSLLMHQHPHLLISLLRDPDTCSFHLSKILIGVWAQGVPGRGRGGSAAPRAWALAGVGATDGHAVRPRPIWLGRLDWLDRLRCATVVDRTHRDAVLVLLIFVSVEVDIVGDRPVYKLVQCL